MKKALILLTLSLFSMTYAHAYDFVVENPDGVMIYYNKNGTDATVTYETEFRSNYSGNVVIPNEVTYNGTTYVVTAIGEEAFYSCRELTSIIIPNSIISIGNYAIEECSGLTSLIIPNSVISIGDYAFSNCHGLTSLTIPNSVTSIGYGAFEDCSGLTSLSIPNSITYIDEFTFYYCSGLTSISIPNSVTSIGAFAFSSCSSLKNIIFEDGDSTLSFGRSYNSDYSETTFADCPLDSLYLGRNISNSPFRNQTLTSITIGNTVTSIEDNAFTGCNRLKELLVNNPTPATIFENTFPENFKSVPIYIPLELFVVYGTTNFWKDLFLIGKDNDGALYNLTQVLATGGSIITVNNEDGEYILSKLNENITVSLKDAVAKYRILINGTDFTSDFQNNTTVTFTPRNINRIDTYQFTPANSFVVHVEKSGTLIDSIGVDNLENVKELVVSGNLNGTDILTIRKMTNLVNLDMTDANIVSGGEYYYGYNKTIPNTIGYYFFKDMTNLAFIKLPDTVTMIGSYAFDGCINLNSILIPNLVTSIGYNAFQNCTGLTSLTIPNSVTDIGDYAFYNCTGLTGTLTIPNSVISIGNSAFQRCKKLTSLTISNSVTTIGGSAFQNCNGLTSIVIPNSVTSIGGYAFADCSNLKNIVFEDGAATLSFGSSNYPYNSDKVFENSPLGSLYIGRNILFYYLSPFENKTTLTSITFGNLVTSIQYGAFSNCSGLTGTLTIPNSVTDIGNYAFLNCNGLTGILAIPNSVISIKDGTFSNCSGLTSVVIPNSVTDIGANAFSGCSGLTGTLAIPDLVTSIGSSAFSGCSGLTGTLTIPNSITSIGDHAFSGCSGLKNIVLEDGTATLSFDADGTFENCFIDSLYLGRNLSYYSYYSPFKGQTSLTSVTIGNLVTSIGDGAFWGCSKLTSITIPNSVATIGKYALEDCSGLTGMLIIPNSVVSIGDYAFSHCSGFTSIAIPNSITSIGEGTFFYCSGLHTCPIFWIKRAL